MRQLRLRAWREYECIADHRAAQQSCSSRFIILLLCPHTASTTSMTTADIASAMAPMLGTGCGPAHQHRHTQNGVVGVGCGPVPAAVATHTHTHTHTHTKGSGKAVLVPCHTASHGCDVGGRAQRAAEGPALASLKRRRRRLYALRMLRKLASVASRSARSKRSSTCNRPTNSA